MIEPSGVPVLLCGDVMRRDDGVALIAARRLPARVAARAELRAVGQLDPQLLIDAGRPCVVVDAVVGIPPGEVVSLPLLDVAALGAPAPHSSHALPAASVVELARILGADLATSRLVGIGIGDVRFGARLSPAVRRGLPGLVAALSAAIAELDQLGDSTRVEPCA